MSKPAPDLQGLQGWLIVVGLSMVIEPVHIATIFQELSNNVFHPESWLHRPDRDFGYSGILWEPLTYVELAFAFASFWGRVVLLLMFLGKKRAFPQLFIELHIVSLVFFFFDRSVLYGIFPSRPLMQPYNIFLFLQAVLPVLIWIPYMQRSELVKRTFVE
ncbi:MAG TPA: DUF2569 domain-containing protein [Telluria sp.]|jgi:hypothetical protein